MVKELLRARLKTHGKEDHYDKILLEAERLAERGNFNTDAILLIIIDSNFNKESILKQLRINCCEHDNQIRSPYAR